MNLIGVLDVLSMAGFGCALIQLVRASRKTLDPATKYFFGAAFTIYLFVGLSNTFEHTGITARLDAFEDYAEDLFVPFFLFGLYAMSAARHLDQRVAAEDELRSSRERYRTLVDNVDLGITLVDPGFRILMSNAAQGRLVELRPEEFLGRTCHDVFEGRSEPCEVCAGREALSVRRPVTKDKAVQRADGRRLTVRLRAFPLFSKEGRPEGFIEVVEDRTQRVREEAERSQIERQIVQARKVDSLVALTGGIAHDFNNLLMGILGNAEMGVMKVPSDSPALPLFRRIENAALRASDLTRQMAAYSGAQKPDLVPVDLNQVVGDLAQLIQSVAPRGVTALLRLSPNLPPVRGDADQLRQVVMAFASNASEVLGESGGTIEVSTGLVNADHAYLAAAAEELGEGFYAYVEVADTGPGIPADALPQLFDPFYSTKEAGRGLGLPAALGITRNHGGTIRVDSTPGRGSRFRLLLPCGAEPAAGQREESPAEHRLPGQGRTIIVVADDEETIRTVTRLSLAELGFRVIPTRSLAECPGLAKEHSGHLAAVIVDVALPGATDPARVGAVRAACPGAAVLLSCGRCERAEAEVAAREQAAEVVYKPYLRSDLVAAVTRAIGRRGAEGEEV